MTQTEQREKQCILDLTNLPQLTLSNYLQIESVHHSDLDLQISKILLSPLINVK